MAWHWITLFRGFWNLAWVFCAGALVASCASGTAEQDESVGVSQSALACLCGSCPEVACNTVSCGTGRVCCVYQPISDGKACFVGRETGVCNAGVCSVGSACRGCVQVLKDGTTTCAAGSEPRACGAGGVACNNCDDNNACTDTFCDPASGTCSHTPVRDGTACPSGVCSGGACCRGCIDARGVCHDPTPEFCGAAGSSCKPCVDTNPCTDDVCTAGACNNPPKADGVSCESDGDVCNGKDVCSQGRCVGGTPPTCDDQNDCTDNDCDPAAGCVYPANDAPCSDTNPCTVGDRCVNKQCVSGEPVDCNDNEECTNDTCTATGCAYSPVRAGRACDDGNTCNQGDACNGSGVCLASSGLMCEDGNPCTVRGCNPLNPTQCLTTLEPVGTPCVPPADKCRVNSSCNSAGDCAGGTEKDCNDNNPCTRDDCDPQSGECVNVAVDAGGCSDGSACTTEDHCEAGECVGFPVECAAIDDCHSPGTCNPETGLCDDPRKPNGERCAADTGACRNGACVADPPSETGAGGDGAGGAADAGAGEGGAAGESTGGRAGMATTPDAGEAPGTVDPGRGDPFEREPGGCGCSVPGSETSQLPFGLVTLGAFAAALRARRRNERRRHAA